MNFYKVNTPMYLPPRYGTLLTPQKGLSCPPPVIATPKVTTTVT